jgi:GNAT superfamily N-acetyltransferase
VPYDERETGTAMDLVRGAWRRMGKPATKVPLHVVHRIDRATSGLLMFAKSKRAEVGLGAQLRDHSVERTYACVAHGKVVSGRIESMLVEDRGDGIRGSARHADQGKRAVTHVTAQEVLRHATICEVRLETGKTHQIRIHLAESGHPLVGETDYIRDYEAAGHRLLTSGRLMLHAATLGFVHPITGEHVSLSSPLPPDFTAVVARLRWRSHSATSVISLADDACLVVVCARRAYRRAVSYPTDLVIRHATANDCAVILQFIRELAEYERLAHEVVADEAQLRATLFGVRPGAEVLVAELASAPVGFALFFQSYSTFLAKPGLYLEDLFVRPAARGKGVGGALMSALARIAVQRHYGRFEWSVLDWNTPALKFYAALGAGPQSEWTVQRLTGAPLHALADHWPHAVGRQ